jgi:NAD(P)-dependent dehydrogenase (short-subunit alcohol dehydrogenase family)
MKQQDAKAGGHCGVIINMGSAAAHTATPMLTQYTTSKHAVLGLTRSAGKRMEQIARRIEHRLLTLYHYSALDNAKYGIRVVSVSPSWVDTPMLSAALEANPVLQDIIQHAVPMKRTARVEEVSNVVMFLASAKASYVTGSDWVVDGGTLLSAQ